MARKKQSDLPVLPTVSAARFVADAVEQYEKRAARDKTLVTFGRRNDGVDWARKVMARIGAGERLPIISEDMAKEALARVEWELQAQKREAEERAAQAEARAAAQRQPGQDEGEAA